MSANPLMDEGIDFVIDHFIERLLNLTASNHIHAALSQDEHYATLIQQVEELADELADRTADLCNRLPGTRPTRESAPLQITRWVKDPQTGRMIVEESAVWDAGQEDLVEGLAEGESDTIPTEEDEPAPSSPPMTKEQEELEQKKRLAKLRRTMSAWRKGRRVSDFAEPPLDWVPPPKRPRHSLPAPGPSRLARSSPRDPSSSSSRHAIRPPLPPKPLVRASVFNPRPEPIPLDSSDDDDQATSSERRRSRKRKGKQREGATVISSGGGKEGSFIKKLRRISREGRKDDDDDD